MAQWGCPSWGSREGEERVKSLETCPPLINPKVYLTTSHLGNVVLPIRFQSHYNQAPEYSG